MVEEQGGNALQDGATVGTSDSGSGDSELAEREERRNVLEETECRRARFVGRAVGRRNAVGKVGDSGGRVRDSALRWLGASMRDGRFNASRSDSVGLVGVRGWMMGGIARDTECTRMSDSMAASERGRSAVH